MTDESTPYWLMEEFVREHGRKGPSQLLREFPDTHSWSQRRAVMKGKYPDLVPALDRQGHVIGVSVTPTPVDGGVGRDEAEREVRQDAGAYTESTEILEDGTQKSDKLLEMSAEQSKDVEYLLHAHGFDPCEWELISARNNIWNVYSRRADGEGHDISTLYSSRITVRPLTSRIDLDAIVAAVCAVEPVYVASPAIGEGMLEVNNTDMHLGNSTFELYRPNLERTIARIRAREWAEIVVPIGSDLFHCDNFKNTTSNGTLQSSVDWPQAWADATCYFAAIIDAALAQSPVVYLYYIIGNHDESMAWAFCQMLAARYPQVTFDLRIEERKVHTFGRVAIGMTHGDNRTRKDLDRIFMAEFPSFASATVREVHAGHYHHEVTRDEYGVVVRSLSTAARADKWHREEGYVGAMKRFTLFEYELDALTDVHYV